MVDRESPAALLHVMCGSQSGCLAAALQLTNLVRLHSTCEGSHMWLGRHSLATHPPTPLLQHTLGSSTTDKSCPVAPALLKIIIMWLRGSICLTTLLYATRNQAGRKWITGVCTPSSFSPSFPQPNLIRLVVESKFHAQNGILKMCMDQFIFHISGGYLK